MNKPTYDEVAHMLMQLTIIADNSIPSDDLSNMQLNDAEIAISKSWEILERIQVDSENNN